MSWDRRIESWLRTVHQWGNHWDPRILLVILGEIVIIVVVTLIVDRVVRAVTWGLRRIRARIERSCRGCRDRERRLAEISEAHSSAQEHLLQASFDSIIRTHQHATKLIAHMAAGGSES